MTSPQAPTPEHENAVRAALEDDRAAAAVLDAVFTAAPVGLAAYAPDGRLRRVNPAGERLGGLSADRVVGRMPVDVLEELGREMQAAIREAATSGRPVERVFSGPLPGHEGVQHRRVTCFPVLGADGAVVGLGSVMRDAGPELAAEEERERLLREAFVARAQAEADGIRAQLARAEAEDALDRVVFLIQATDRLVGSMNPDETIRELARIVVPALADRCSIDLVGPGGHLLPAAVAPPEAELGTGVPASVERVVRSGASELVASVDPRLRALGLESGLTVPLRAGRHVLGAMTLHQGASGRRLDASDVPYAEALAARAALAVENARLYSERSAIAYTLQRALLPAALPEVPGVRLAARYRPAGVHNAVGGDFYDVTPTQGGAWMAVMGDVAGKGAEAAAVTALSRHTLRAGALRGDDPVEHLRLLDEALRAQPPTAAPAAGFCTVLLARVCPEAAGLAVTLATGGHPPPVLVRPGGAAEPVDVRGSLVGALPGARFGTREVGLAPGERLVLYTDGLVELRGVDAREGEREMLDCLSAHAGDELEDLLRGAEEHAVRRQAGEPRDDIALLALEATGKHPPDRS